MMSLLQTDSDHPHYQRDYAISIDHVGLCHAAWKQSEPAFECFQQSLRMRRGLLSDASGNHLNERDLSISHTLLGDLRFAERLFEEALRHYRDSLEIDSKLAERLPHHTGVLRDLAVTHWYLGLTHQIMGKPAAARGNFEAYLSTLGKCRHFPDQRRLIRFGEERLRGLSKTKRAKISKK
jgi:tetratricopeptide (TPR) repeat protein